MTFQSRFMASLCALWRRFARAALQPALPLSEIGPPWPDLHGPKWAKMVFRFALRALRALPAQYKGPVVSLKIERLAVSPVAGGGRVGHSKSSLG